MEMLGRLAALRYGFAAGLVLVALYVPLRATGSPEPFHAAWTVVAILATLASPLAGLTVLAAIGPFTQALATDGSVTAVPFVVAALGFAVLIRLVVDHSWPRLSLPLLLAGLLLAGTAVGVGVSWALYGTQRGIEAAQLWVPGIGGGMTVLIGSAWLAWRGEIRPLAVAVASITTGAVLGVANTLTDGALRANLLGWLLRGDGFPNRLGALMPASNAVAAVFLAGFAICLAVALLDHRRNLRIIATVAAGVQLAALMLTYSRSGMLALAVVVALLAWRRWRRLGLIAAVVALVGAVGLSVWAAVARDIPVAAEGLRIDAWLAATRMWLDHLLIGAGFRSFEWLHADYGSGYLDAPHNEWLRLFAEEGTAIGVAGVAFALAAPLLLLRTRGYLAAGAGAAAAGVFLMASFNNPFLYTQFNVPVFLVIGTGLGVAQRLAASRSGTQRTPISNLERSILSA